MANVIGQEIERTAPRQAVQYNFHATIGEAALETLGNSYETREATIDFLTEPFNEGSAKKMIERVDKAAKSSLEKEKFGKFLIEGRSQEAKIEQMRLFHKNFWSLLLAVECWQRNRFFSMMPIV